jgi:carbon starvation protein CstA
VREQRVVSNPPSSGRLAGALLGAVAGILLALIWLLGAWDVVLAVTAVFAGLVAVLFAGSPSWRTFATTLPIVAGAVGGLLVFITRYIS